jgi:hypothetical protein
VAIGQLETCLEHFSERYASFLSRLHGWYRVEYPPGPMRDEYNAASEEDLRESLL